MSVNPSDWQCGMPVEGSLRCTESLINMGTGHPGPCVHEHDYTLFRPGETMCGCDPVASSERSGQPHGH